MHTIEQPTSLRAAYWAFLRALGSREPEAPQACSRALKLYREALRHQRTGARLARLSPSRRAHLKDVRRRWKRLDRKQVGPSVIVVPFDKLTRIARIEDAAIE